MLCLFVFTLIQVTFKHHKKNGNGALLLLLSVLVSFGLINYLKAVFGMDCPWDLTIYGGTKPYNNLWSPNDSLLSPGRCFPSGHSSIGFAWIALYFFWRKARPKLAKTALFLSILTGLILGFSQQLRGAHFFVDDLATVFICWSIAFLIFSVGEPYETEKS